MRTNKVSNRRYLKVGVVMDMKERIQHKLLAGGHKKLEQQDTRLPKISIQMTSINPDTQRYTGKNYTRILRKDFDPDTPRSSAYYDLQPYPITIEYTVSIWAKYFEHYSQILENIMPWFDDYMTVGVKERNFGIERELKVNMTGVSQNHTFEMEGGQARIIRGDITFSVETVAYKTLSEDISNLIEKVQVHVIDIQTPITSETISICASPEDYLQ
jgi:hypothetical protein